MSLDIYKALNNELVSKVQEYKKSNTFLERELIILNRKYQEEHELRLDERFKFLAVISRWRSNLDDVELFLRDEETSPSPCAYSKSQGSPEERRRTRSSGVTNRSPIRRKSLQQSAHDNSDSEVQDENAETQPKVNCWGFADIKEANTHSELDGVEEVIIPAEALSRLNITEEQSPTIGQETQTSNDSSTVIQVSNDSEINIARTIGAPSIDEEELFNCIQTPNTANSSPLSVNEFFLQAVHSTPYNFNAETDAETEVTIANDIIACHRSPAINVSVRPRRNCAPGSLVEPSVRTKLRNENVTRNVKSKGKTHSSKRETTTKTVDDDMEIHGSHTSGESKTDETENQQNHLNVEHSAEKSKKVLVIEKNEVKKKSTGSKIRKKKLV